MKAQRSTVAKADSPARLAMSIVATLIVVLVTAVCSLTVLSLVRQVDLLRSGGGLSAVVLARLGALLVAAVVLVAVSRRLLSPDAGYRRSFVLPQPVFRELDRIRQVSMFGVGSLVGWTVTNPEVTTAQLRAPASVGAVREALQRIDRGAAGSAPLGNGGLVGGRLEPAVGDGSRQPRAAEGLLEVNHVVGRGDTWWSLAEDVFGDGARWVEVRECNLGRAVDGGTIIDEETDLRRGWRIALPADTEKAER